MTQVAKLEFPNNNNINNPHQVGFLMHKFLKQDFIQEAFNQIIVHREDVENKRIADFQDELGKMLPILKKFHLIDFFSVFSFTVAYFSALTPPEAKETALGIYLTKTATETNLSQLKLLLGTLNKLVGLSVLNARLVCEQVLSCEKLSYKNQVHLTY